MTSLARCRALLFAALAQLDATTWRATFHRDHMAAQDGFGADRTPWAAVQRAAWVGLRKSERYRDT